MTAHGTLRASVAANARTGAPVGALSITGTSVPVTLKTA